ncbi:MAG: hypothetical protein LBM68_06980 [Bacteroidales bacterium]|nr:hypothetical protein [Bacteroidales bacterium]
MGIVGFDGATSNGFVNPFSGTNVSMIIDNTAPTGSSVEARPIYIALHKGYYENVEEMTEFSQSVDGIVNDGIFIPATSTSSAVSASGQNCRIIDLRKSFEKLPMRIKGLRVKCTEVDQLDQAIEVYQLGPHKPKPIAVHTPSALKNETESDQTRASLDLTSEMIVLGEDKAILYKVLPGVKVTVTYFMSDRMSQSAQLENAIAGGLV